MASIRKRGGLQWEARIRREGPGRSGEAGQVRSLRAAGQDFAPTAATSSPFFSFTLQIQGHQKYRVSLIPHRANRFFFWGGASNKGWQTTYYLEQHMEPPIHSETCRAKIKIISVGGGGGTILNEMIEQKVHGVEFIAVNTDTSALESCLAEQKIQIGENLTKDLSTLANPQIGRQAALDDIEKLKAAVNGADMVVIAAGMGGGVGTGAAPVIAQVAKESGALTVGVVSHPACYEGEKRLKTAKAGIKEMLAHSDSVVVIPHSAIDIGGCTGTTAHHAYPFNTFNRVHCSAVRGIVDLITAPGLIELDFADVKAVLKSGGLCLMGEGEASGAWRARYAFIKATRSPSLVGVPVGTTRGLLIKMSVPPDYSIDEIGDAASMLQENARENTRVFFQAIPDDAAGDEIHVTMIVIGIRLVEDGGGMENSSQGSACENPDGENEVIFNEKNFDNAYLRDFISRAVN
ncbi:cell division protein FtsZ [Desulfovibrio sp. OttesenSCG-928-G15]|nr:cell division protein FtsZ [Desulfovibrio sp. OttesenSCG-928-G15]